ncbi:MAG TPA: hypothetical protein VGO04_03700 [Ensifer sp.]|jgi:drug/metabolite transporter (DMT)-like permease|uniref:hypothetical protein n=1 Tax=Ensifer sp. TaxID=1872086 RepID=UPI002E11E709|nr:hypothetical protein [Ensifer sp.]
MPRLAQLYFKTAIIFLIIGLLMGLHMAISQDHAATPAHAHTNLLGWVTMAIFGVYYALNPAKAERRLALVQYYVYTSGVAVLVPSLYLMTTGNPEIEPIVAAASIVAFLGVLLFAVIIFTSAQTIGQQRAAPLR